MPVYEYECRGCNGSFEHFHRSGNRKTAAVCPSCGSRDVRRKLSVFSAPQGAAKPCSVPTTGGCPGCCDRGPSCHI